MTSKTWNELHLRTPPEFTMIRDLLTIILSLTLLSTISGYKSPSLEAPQSLTHTEILSTFSHALPNPTRKYPNLEILAFVTPWNPSGKEETLREAENGRLDMVSPVSWQMHPDALRGGDDIERDYYKSISRHGSRVYPRVLFEAAKWDCSSFRKLAWDVKPMVDRLVSLCKQGGFDGVVVEIWQAVVASGCMQSSSREMIHMVRDIGTGIREASLHATLVLFPYTDDVSEHGITRESLRVLAEGYSHVITMTYDYTTPNAASGAGPMAPVSWMRKVAAYLMSAGIKGKLLLGVNFYGALFNRGVRGEDRHVTGNDMVDFMQSHRPDVIWAGGEVGEHAFVVDGGDQVAFYPTRASIALRILLADELELAGVAIWEAGQGMKYLFEEF